MQHNCVEMQHINVIMQITHVNMRLNYVNMQLFLRFFPQISCLMTFILHVNITILQVDIITLHVSIDID